MGLVALQDGVAHVPALGRLALTLGLLSIPATDLLNDRVLPWYEEQSVHLLRILTDRGTEFNGSIENHEYQLYLAIENIGHSKTKARHPETNDISECFQRTIEEEFYDFAFRKNVYGSLDEL